MSEQSLARRQAVAAFIIRFRQFIFEAAGGCFAFCVAWRAIDTFEGKPAAPFTASALLEVGNGVWFWGLLLAGALKWAGVIVGMRTGNGFLLRGIIGAFAAFVWTCVFVGGVTAPGPLSVSSGYGAMAVCSWIEALALVLSPGAFHGAEESKTRRCATRLSQAGKQTGKQEAACGSRQRVF